jgi:hypothetical protein
MQEDERENLGRDILEEIEAEKEPVSEEEEVD